MCGVLRRLAGVLVLCTRGQLGHGDTENQREAKVLEALEGVGVISIAAGGWHSMALTDFGDIYTWGWNLNGQLGFPSRNVHDEDVMNKDKQRQGDVVTHDKNEYINFQVEPKFLQICSEETKVKVISCGSRHSACLTETNEVYTWGWNKYGQLGLGHDNSRYSPEKVQLDGKVPLKVYCGEWNTFVSVK